MNRAFSRGKLAAGLYTAQRPLGGAISFPPFISKGSVGEQDSVGSWQNLDGSLRKTKGLLCSRKTKPYTWGIVGYPHISGHPCFMCPPNARRLKSDFSWTIPAGPFLKRIIEESNTTYPEIESYTTNDKVGWKVEWIPPGLKGRRRLSDSYIWHRTLPFSKAKISTTNEDSTWATGRSFSEPLFHHKIYSTSITAWCFSKP